MAAEWRLSRSLLFFAAALTIGIALMAYLQSAISSKYWPVGVDVYPVWAGTFAFWQGESPYGEAVQLQTQQLIYGRPSRHDEDAFGFYYPAFVSVVMLPLIFLPARWAAATWSGAQLALLFTLLVFWSWRLKPQPRPWVWGVLLLSGMLFRPALLVAINGQYGLFVVVCGVVAWRLVSDGRDNWAGAVLAVATIKPSLALLPLLVLLLWAIRRKRWNILFGFAANMFLLVSITLLRLGWWIPDFVNRSLAYSQDHLGQGLAWSAEHIWTPAGLVWLIGALVLLGIGLESLWRISEFPWTAVLGALSLNLLLTPHTVEYDLTVLLIPLLWLGSEWRRYGWGLPLWMTLIWTPWLSWLSLLATGNPIEAWWQVIWQFYPSLLIGATLFWFAWERLKVNSSVARAVIPPDFKR